MPSLERVRSPTWQTQHGRHPQWSSVVLSEAKIVSVTLPAGRALREHRDLPGGHRRWHADECEAIANDDTATELVVPPLTISGANASQQRRQLLKVDMLPLLCQHRALARDTSATVRTTSWDASLSAPLAQGCDRFKSHLSCARRQRHCLHPGCRSSGQADSLRSLW
jgi:hypothetical protein